MHDVLITGSGLAGCALAIQLRRMGLQVLVAGRARRMATLEGMAERGRMALQTVGCEQSLAAFGPCVSRRANWSGESFQNNQEYLIERRRLDAALLQDASEAGAEVVETHITRIQHQAEHWQMELAGTTVRAAYWVEARGRQSPRAIGYQLAPRVLGLGAWWQSQRDAPIAGVCPFENGWCWYGRLPDGRLNLQCFVDAVQLRAAGQTGLRAGYLHQLATCDGVQELIAGATLTSEPCARGAQLQIASSLIGDRQARVGDAALALDPLSGHGMFEAIGGALALAPCICTALQRSEDASLARDFYQTRIRGEFWRLARTGRDFHRLEQRWVDKPYWAVRQDWPDHEPAHPPSSAGEYEIVERPVSVEGYIERRNVVVCPDMPRGVWQVDGVPLVELLRHIAAAGVVSPMGIEQVATHAGWPVSATLRAVRWLYDRQIATGVRFDPGVANDPGPG